MAKRAIRTRNGGTITEAAYWGGLRSALRRHYRYWKPAIQALKQAERPSKSKNKRLKYEYQCAKCKQWFPRKDVQIDHVTPCGSLKGPDDIAGFLERLTPESPEAYQVLDKKCHKIKTQEERNK